MCWDYKKYIPIDEEKFRFYQLLLQLLVSGVNNVHWDYSHEVYAHHYKSSCPLSGLRLTGDHCNNNV